MYDIYKAWLWEGQSWKGSNGFCGTVRLMWFRVYMIYMYIKQPKVRGGVADKVIHGKFKGFERNEEGNFRRWKNEGQERENEMK